MLYVMSLDELTFFEVKAAVMKLLRTAKFFPTIAEIFEAVDSLKETATGRDTKDAGEAWEEAMKLVRTCHMYKPWTFSTPEVEQAVKQFGKRELIALETDDVNTARAQFMRIYNRVVERKKQRENNEKVLTKLNVPVNGKIENVVNLLTDKMSVS
jgi:hypothetical protein